MTLGERLDVVVGDTADDRLGPLGEMVAPVLTMRQALRIVEGAHG